MHRIGVSLDAFGGFEDLNTTIVRVIAPLATLAAVVLAAVGIMTGNDGFLVQAAGGVFVGGLAWIQSWLHRENAAVVLTAA